MYKFISALVLFMAISTLGYAASIHHAGHNMGSSKPLLTEAGNDIFGTLQEVLQQLIADPKTDWSKVNMEALRQHLVDMRNFTVEVEVISQSAIKNGIEIILKPNNEKVSQSLDRVFAAHPIQLKRETGWDMKTKKEGDHYKITVTVKSKKDVIKVNGLGYIGLMAWGNHHQNHHWMMAKGMNPH